MKVILIGGLAVVKNYVWQMIKAMPLCLMLSYNTAWADDNTNVKSSVAIFAGGCFWCMEPPFDKVPGVLSTRSGYTGGHAENPSYKEVSNGKTGHSEAVEIIFDPNKVSYQQLLEVFWHNIDPFNDEGQFCDSGEQYKAAVFYADDNQRQLAETSKQQIIKMFGGKPVVTTIKPAAKFFPAEDYHQDYYLKNPKTYKFYRFTCGRDYRLKNVWGNYDE